MAGAAAAAAASTSDYDYQAVQTMGPTRSNEETLHYQDVTWAVRLRRERKKCATSLSCPTCLKVVCIDRRRYYKRQEDYVYQYRAVCVRNCRVVPTHQSAQNTAKASGSSVLSNEPEEEPNAPEDDDFKSVRCVICDTEVALRDIDYLYHFYNVIPGFLFTDFRS